MLNIKYAQKLKSKIESKEKNKKFENMVEIQQRFIVDNMEQGKNSVVWIFNDREYYNNNLEKEWYEEFRAQAKALFEKKGYAVNGVVIRW